MEQEYNAVKKLLSEHKCKITFSEFPTLFRLIREKTSISSSTDIYKILIALMCKKPIIDDPEKMNIPSKFKEIH